MLSAALRYADRGWKVFPLQGKEPLPGSRGFLDATTDEDKIHEWWEPASDEYWARGLPTGVGIATGQISGIVVLDIDRKHGGLENVEKMPGQLPPTYTVGTGGGGLHFYFHAPPGIELRNRVGLLPGIDFRGDGGYVAAPPSLHPSGKKYVVLEDNELAPLPQWLLEFVRKDRAPKPEGLVATAQAVPEGGRNDFLTRLGGSMRRRGLSQDAIDAALKAENLVKCKPPLPEGEVARIARNVARYEPENPIVPIVVTARALSVTAAELSESSLAYLRDKEKVKGQPTLIYGLDELLGGGKRLGELTAWHAVAKTGKNTFWHKQMHLWLKAGIPIGYASRELNPEEEVLPDLLSIEHQENARLAAMDDERASRYAKSMAEWGHLYFAKGYGYFPGQELMGWISEMKAMGVNYLWFDHLHYMLEDPEDHKQAAKLIRDLKATAKREQMHFDIIIQPNKLQEGERLSLNSIKGGAAMGQAIDNLITLERHEPTGEKNMARLSMKAARSKLAKTGSILLLYNPTTIDTIEVKDVTPDVELRIAANEKGNGLNERNDNTWWQDEKF